MIQRNDETDSFSWEEESSEEWREEEVHLCVKVLLSGVEGRWLLELSLIGWHIRPDSDVEVERVVFLVSFCCQQLSVNQETFHTCAEVETQKNRMHVMPSIYSIQAYGIQNLPLQVYAFPPLPSPS